MNATTMFFFFVMIFAPCAVALFSALRKETVDSPANAAELPRLAEAAAELDRLVPAEVAQPLKTRALLLEDKAGAAEEDARLAYAVAARARAAALVAKARAASARAEVAAELAEEAALAAEAAAKVAAEMREAQRQYTTPARTRLPQDHPSLDFPRSRVIRRAA